MNMQLSPAGRAWTSHDAGEAIPKPLRRKCGRAAGWQGVALVNPVVYLISGFRWSLCATRGDLSCHLPRGVWWIFMTGYGLKRESAVANLVDCRSKQGERTPMTNRKFHRLLASAAAM